MEYQNGIGVVQHVDVHLDTETHVSAIDFRLIAEVVTDTTVARFIVAEIQSFAE